MTCSKVITLPKLLQLSWLEAICLLCGNEFNSTSMAMVVSEGINYCNFWRHSLNIRCLSFLKHRKVLESDIWARRTVFLSTTNIFDLKLVNVENPFNTGTHMMQYTSIDMQRTTISGICKWIKLWYTFLLRSLSNFIVLNFIHTTSNKFV